MFCLMYVACCALAQHAGVDMTTYANTTRDTLSNPACFAKAIEGSHGVVVEEMLAAPLLCLVLVLCGAWSAFVCVHESQAEQQRRTDGSDTTWPERRLEGEASASHAARQIDTQLMTGAHCSRRSGGLSEYSFMRRERRGYRQDIPSAQGRCMPHTHTHTHTPSP